MKKSVDTDPNAGQEEVPEVGRFRQVLPQVIACTVKNFLLLDLGLTMAMPTIIIPALLGLNGDINPNETIHITPEDASWLASIGYVVVPIGSLLSGWVTEPFGRKRAFIFTQIPHLIAWMLLYNSTTFSHVLWAQVFIGLGHGLMEAPLITYIGEVVESSLRSVLIAVSGIAATLGFFIVYVMGSVTEWRNVSLYCFSVPVITMIAVCFIPETPLWLLSKDRTEDALKSLQWLRGWVSPKAVEKEFNELKRHSQFTKKCAACYKKDKECVHPPATALEKLRGLFLISTLKPLTILLMIYTLGQLTGTYALRPYLILIFEAYGTPISANHSTVILGLTSIIATIVCCCIIKVVGKRKLFLVTLVLCSIPKISLGIYGLVYLPLGTTSFYPNEGVAPPTGNYYPLVAFVLMQFINSVGVAAIPHVLFSEMLPYKTRGVATGIASSVNYLVSFVINKTYYDLEMIFSLPGTIIFYGIMCLVAAFISYFIHPETENRSLEDIEMHYADKTRSFFDRKIQKNAGENSAHNHKA